MNIKTQKPNNEAKTCYIYCRVSTEEQANEGFSLDNQKRACVDYAKRNGYVIRDEFTDEGKSGRTIDRPEFKKLLQNAKKSPVDAVIIYKIDRFARNVTDFSRIRKEFIKANVNFHSVTEGDLTNGSSLIANIFASVAEWESEVNGQRTKDAMTQKFRSGWWPGWAPLGYKNVEGEDGRGIIVIDKEKGPLIVKAFKLYGTGDYSLLKLTKILHKKGLRTRNGKPIAHSTIHQILTNTFYYGLMKWGKPVKQEVMGNHKPLISRKLFDLCQLVAAKHRNHVIRERKHNFLLRGIVFCDQCGLRYTAEWHKITRSKNRDKIAYYHCSKQGPCKSKYVESEDLETKVADLLKGIKFSKGFTDAVTRKVKRYLKDRDRLEAKERNLLLRKRTKLTNKRQILEDRLMDETIQRDTFKRLHNELQVDISAIDTDLAKMESTRKFDFDLLEEVLALTRNIPKAYKKAPVFLKRKYLNFFFEQIQVDNKNIVNTAFSPLVQELIEQQEVILRPNWLPSPEVIRTCINKIVEAFEDTIQTELIRVRWDEINKLQPQAAMARV